MPCVCYTPKAFRRDTLAVIGKANKIIVDYQRQGFKLTLRQLYYQFVVKDLFPEDRKWSRIPGTNKWRRDPDGTKNAEPNYKWLGEIINDARLAGLIDWLAIEDRTRNLQTHATWGSPHSIVRACADQYTVDLWVEQANHVEVWIEKEALLGIIEPICIELQVPFFACKGYTSQSGMWEAAQRLKRFERDGRETIIVHLGDHDPSGIDMTRDIQDRLELFGSTVSIHRIALTWDQIQEYSPPPNPAKATDARYTKYEEEFGDESWELDALEPAVMADLIREAVESHIDRDYWEEAEERQQTGRDQLGRVSACWKNVVAYLENGHGTSN